MSSDITLVTTFKGFDNSLDALCQCSAVFSWRVEKFKVLAIGDDIGVQRLCQDAGFGLVPKVRRASDLGLQSPLPMLRDLFQIILSTVTTGYFCLTNSDIIVGPQFQSKLGEILFHNPNSFVTGARQDIQLDSEVTTKAELDAAWRLAHGVYHSGGGTDFFAMSKGLAARILSVMPDYVLGATAWDNWLHWVALKMGEPPINATLCLPTLHAQHDYRVLSGEGRSGIRQHPSVVHNQRIFQTRGERASINSVGWITACV